MPIDFHDPANRCTYAGRVADETWRTTARELVDPTGLHVVDVGCGGGTYSHAWLDLGARSVTGVDMSAQMLSAAREPAAGRAGLLFAQGEAQATGLPDGCADLVFERALLHHVPQREAAAREAHRLLRPGGVLLVQDRVVDDVSLPGSVTHPRGWFFERFPRLLDVELARRPTTEGLSSTLREAGFTEVTTSLLWERRRTHPTREDFLLEIGSRTGRSILHDLDDDELGELVAYLRERLPAEEPVVETDRWTLWRAVRA